MIILFIKFSLFLRVFDVKYGGKNLAKIYGVAEEVLPFLLYLVLIIIGFSHAFFILLRSIKNSDLVTTYSFVNSDGIISSTPTLVQTPDSNTNLFNWFPTSLLAMYLFLAGNNLNNYLFKLKILLTLIGGELNLLILIF